MAPTYEHDPSWSSANVFWDIENANIPASIYQFT